MLFIEDAINELQTIGDLVRWGASQFQQADLHYGHGTDNALDEAFHLVTHTLSLPFDLPPYMIMANLTKAERRKVLEILAKRVTTRLPAPYITQQAWFAGMTFYVDENVLIPRSPIAELIESSFEPWIDADNVHNILDLCTGSGCIAIACAMMFPNAQVDATDISPGALEVAAKNVAQYQLEDRLTLIHSDIFAAIPQGKQYDIIVTNPPYVDAEDMAALNEEFHHEPPLALTAGDDGLDIVRQILKQALQFLAPGGVLVVEVGNSMIALQENYPEVPFMWPEFERGGHGVFILSYDELKKHQDHF